jgi:CheY-like chemotaxis protein
MTQLDHKTTIVIAASASSLNSSSSNSATETTATNHYTSSLSLELDLDEKFSLSNCNNACTMILGRSATEIQAIANQSNWIQTLVVAAEKKDEKKGEKELRDQVAQEKFLQKLQAQTEEKEGAAQYNIVNVRHKNGLIVPLIYCLKHDAKKKTTHFSAIDLTHHVTTTKSMFERLRNIKHRLDEDLKTCGTEYDESKIEPTLTDAKRDAKALLDNLEQLAFSHRLSSPTITNRQLQTTTKNKTCEDSAALHLDLDLKTGRILEVNAESEKILGFTAEELKAKIITDGGFISIVHKDDKRLVEETFKLRQAGRAGFTVVRIQHKTPGKYVHLICCANPNKDNTAMHIVALDLTPHMKPFRRLVHKIQHLAKEIQSGFTKIERVFHDTKKNQTTKRSEIQALAQKEESLLQKMITSIESQDKDQFLEPNLNVNTQHQEEEKKSISTLTPPSLPSPSSSGSDSPSTPLNNSSEHKFPGIRILGVDDEALNQKKNRNLFVNHFGCDYNEAHNGLEALQALGIPVEEKKEIKKVEPFDMVLMDILMPEMDGLTAIRTIRAWESTQKIPQKNLITCISGNDEKEAALKAGADYFFQKGSYIPQDLENILHNIYAQKMAVIASSSPSQSSLSDTGTAVMLPQTSGSSGTLSSSPLMSSSTITLFATTSQSSSASTTLTNVQTANLSNSKS